MRPHEVERLRDTERMYTKRPHEFVRLGPGSPTCVRCGRCAVDEIHTKKGGDGERGE